MHASGMGEHLTCLCDSLACIKMTSSLRYYMWQPSHKNNMVCKLHVSRAATYKGKAFWEPGITDLV